MEGDKVRLGAFSRLLLLLWQRHELNQEQKLKLLFLAGGTYKLENGESSFAFIRFQAAFTLEAIWKADFQHDRMDENNWKQFP